MLFHHKEYTNSHNAARKQHNEQAHPPPEVKRGGTTSEAVGTTSEAVGGRVQRFVLPVLVSFEYSFLRATQLALGANQFADEVL